MYPASNIWSTLVGAVGHYFEAKVYIDTINEDGEIEAVEFGQDYIVELSSSMGMFSGEEPSAGSCIAAELNLKMHQPNATIPRMAKIQPYVRVCLDNVIGAIAGVAVAGMVVVGSIEQEVLASEWIPQGKFFVDTRETTHDDDGMPIVSFHAYDSMLKAEADYPDTEHDWGNFTDIEVVGEIANVLGVGVDGRTLELMTHGYGIGAPAGMSMREVLSNIAGMYGGNWVMNYDGELLLIAIGGIPVDTNYLIYINGEPISFGSFSEDPEEEVIIFV